MRSLFANMPARRHAVARVQTEVAHIGQVARRLALSAPGVRMALFTEERLVFQTTGSGNLGATLVEIHGAGIGGSLVELSPVEVSGSAAQWHRRWRGRDPAQPGRYPRAREPALGAATRVRAALENAYRPVVPRGRHPIAVVSVETPPDRVDVNIHPAKLEVRLHAERMIATEAGRLVKEILGRRPAPLGFRP